MSSSGRSPSQSERTFAKSQSTFLDNGDIIIAFSHIAVIKICVALEGTS
jgi:hypothetical protein